MNLRGKHRLFIGMMGVMCMWASSTASGAYSTLVNVDSAGKLQYHSYSLNGDIIPDFSEVGYKGGGVPLPEVPAAMTLNPAISDNFNTTAEGIAPADWTIATGGGGVAVTESPDGQKRSLRLQDTSLSQIVSASKAFSMDSDFVTVEFKIKFADTGVSYVWLRSGQTEGIRLRASGGTGTQLQYLGLNGSGTAAAIASAKYTVNQWHTVKLEADLASQTGRYYFDGATLGEELPLYNPVSMLDTFQVSTHSAGEATVYVDDVTIASTDDSRRIQQAIDIVSALPEREDGFRGALLLRGGTYHVEEPLYIRTSGVVVRGEGQGVTGGTVVKATGSRQYDVLTVRGAGMAAEVPGSRTPIADAYVPVGAKSVTLSDASSYQVGDAVMVHRRAKDSWISELGMDELEGVLPWEPFDYNHYFERKIVAISGNTITLDIPIMLSMDSAVADGFVYRYTFPGRVKQNGVEHMRFDSIYAGDTDEQHGWNAVIFGAAEDGWARKITVTGFGMSAVAVKNDSKRITIQEASYFNAKSLISGGRRYPFLLEGQQNLVEGSHASTGRHDFVLGTRAGGPNVFFNSRSEQSYNISEPHQRYAAGVLYDNISVEGQDSAIFTVNRGNSGSGHGWSGAQVVAWNTRSVITAMMNPPGGGEQNFMIGNTGKVVDSYVQTSRADSIAWLNLRSGAAFSEDGSEFLGDAHTESEGALVEPESLYVRQLKDRFEREGLGEYDLGFTRLEAAADTYADSQAPGAAHGSEEELRLAHLSASDQEAFLKFNLSDINKPISKAALRIHTGQVGSQSAAVYQVGSDAWTEADLTWSNKPSVGAKLGTVQLARTGPGWYELDVTDYIRSQQTGNHLASLAIKLEDTAAEAVLGSKESLLKSHLDIRYELLPNAPVVEIVQPRHGGELAGSTYTIQGTADGASTVRLLIADLVDTLVSADSEGQWIYTVNDSRLNGRANYNIQAILLDGSDHELARDIVTVNPGSLTMDMPADGMITSLPYTVTGSVYGVSGAVQLKLGQSIVEADVFGNSWSYTIPAGTGSLHSQNLTMEAFVQGSLTSPSLQSQPQLVKIRLNQTLRPISDGYAMQLAANQWFATGSMRVRASASYPETYRKNGYISFNISGIESTADKVALRVAASSATGGSLSVYRVDPASTWPSTIMTWSNQPLAAGLAGSVTVKPLVDAGGPEWFGIDVTSHVLAARAAGYNKIAFRLTTDEASSGYVTDFIIKSDEDAGEEPFLEVVQAGSALPNTGVVVALTDESFDSTEPGKVPAQWTVGSTGGAAVAASPSLANRRLLLDDVSQTDPVLVTLALAPTVTPVSVQMELAFNRYNNENSTNVIRLRNGGVEAFRLVTSNNKLYYGNATASNLIYEYGNDVPFQLKLEADPVTQKYNIWINGVLKKSDLSFSNPIDRFDRLVVQTNGATRGQVFLDDVRIETSK